MESCVSRNGVNPRVRLVCTRGLRECLGGCESADHPKLPARPRILCDRICLFGSGSAGLGLTSSHEMILVVEDDEDVLTVAAESLRELGYQVETAVSAVQALDILSRDHPVDLLFSDVIMPGGMNGVQLAVEARRIRPQLKVLLTSGYTATALSLQHGLPDNLDVVEKPYQREELAEKLRLVIGG